MKNHKKLMYVLVGFVFVSCSPKYYIPNTQNVPLLSEKGETNLTVSGNGNQVEFQGALAVSNSIGIKANAGLFIPSDLDNGNGGSGKFIELGGGYFKPIKEVWVFETYGIIGMGSFENHLPSTLTDYPQTNGKISSNIYRFGIQPSFGYKTKYFSAAISSRFVNLTYDKIRGDLTFDNESQQTYLRRNSSNFLIEPAITLRGGLERIKLQVQFGLSFNATNANFKQDYTFLTAGLNFNFK